ncbi:MAG: MFS transporter [Firmicutes bacterium]|nr:MFS transporter [Alicyclobacillaceae bacterium]MCL6497862.1 MFS transporter [Bacillota bacterium]
MNTRPEPLASAGTSLWADVHRDHWRLWLASMLGWVLDSYEFFALALVVIPALLTLLAPAQRHAIGTYAGLAVAGTMLGWGIGGWAGGLVADYLGRKRTMMYSILLYAGATFLTGFSTSWQTLTLFRFLTGLGIGAEWCTGVNLVSEMWPNRARSTGVALLGAGAGVGSLLASGVAAVVLRFPDGWRWMFYLGVLPALLVFWLRRGVPESTRWEQARSRHQAQAESNATAPTERFTLAYVLAHPNVRRYTWLAVLVTTATTVGIWDVDVWIPAATDAYAAAARLAHAAVYGAYVLFVNNLGAILGEVAAGPLSDRWGRRPTNLLALTLALLSVPAFFYLAPRGGITGLLIVSGLVGIVTGAPISWLGIYLPELFPTWARGTGTAFAFNFGRFLTAAAILTSGILVTHLGGVAPAATIVGLIYLLGILAMLGLPETRGRDLPD